MNLLFLLFPFLTSPTPMDVPAGPSLDAVTQPGVERPAPVQPVSCELRQAKRGGEQVVVAAIRASTAAEGEYEFSLKARDAHRNTVSASQGDLFRIKGGERVELDGPSLALGRSGTLKGRLDLRDAEGRAITSCEL